MIPTGMLVPHNKSFKQEEWEISSSILWNAWTWRIMSLANTHERTQSITPMRCARCTRLYGPLGWEQGNQPPPKPELTITHPPDHPLRTHVIMKSSALKLVIVKADLCQPGSVDISKTTRATKSTQQTVIHSSIHLFTQFIHGKRFSSRKGKQY